MTVEEVVEDVREGTAHNEGDWQKVLLLFVEEKEPAQNNHDERDAHAQQNLLVVRKESPGRASIGVVDKRAINSPGISKERIATIGKEKVPLHARHKCRHRPFTALINEQNGEKNEQKTDQSRPFSNLSCASTVIAA